MVPIPDSLLMYSLFTTIGRYEDILFSGVYARIISAILILLVGFIIAKLGSKLVHRVISELEITPILKKASGITIQVEKIAGSCTEYFIYFIAVIMALNQLNITTTVLQMVSGAVIIIVIIAVVLSIKDFIPNAFAGLYIYKNNFVSVGEVVRVKGLEGTVVEITLLETKLETKEGDTVYIPNSALTKTEIVKVGMEKKKKVKEHR